MFQAADPDSGGFAAEGGHRTARTTLADVERALGGPRPATELRHAEVERPDRRSACWRSDATGVDLQTRWPQGLFRLDLRAAGRPAPTRSP